MTTATTTKHLITNRHDAVELVRSAVARFRSRGSGTFADLVDAIRDQVPLQCSCTSATCGFLALDTRAFAQGAAVAAAGQEPAPTAGSSREHPFFTQFIGETEILRDSQGRVKGTRDKEGNQK